MSKGIGTALDNTDKEERIAALEAKVAAMATMIHRAVTYIVKNEKNEDNAYADFEKNKDKIPIGTVLEGTTHGVPYILVVHEDGYYVGNTKYSSLSAAAMDISKVRRSGWEFWKLRDGTTAREAFKR